jgi:HPt (histidine-containing phosphotransfer) domain-containing protein
MQPLIMHRHPFLITSGSGGDQTTNAGSARQKVVHWGLAQDGHQLATEPAAVEISASSEPCDVAYLHELSAGDEDFLLELVELYLEDTEAQIQALETALDAGDRDGTRTWAHTLKGASASFGAGTLRELFHRMEAGAREGQLAKVSTTLVQAKQEFERLQDFLKTTDLTT